MDETSAAGSLLSILGPVILTLSIEALAQMERLKGVEGQVASPTLPSAATFSIGERNKRKSQTSFNPWPCHPERLKGVEGRVTLYPL